MLPFQFSNVATFGVLSSLDKSYRLPYGTFVFLSLIVSIIGIFACYLFMRYIVKPDVSKLQNYKCTEEIPAFNFSQKANMWLFVLLFILLMIPSLITTGPIFAFFNNLGNAASTCIVLVMALFLKDKEGNKVVEFGKLGTLVPWQLVFMISTSLFLASSFGDKSVGINSWLAGLFVPLFKGLSPVILCIMILVVGLVLTNALSNSVICATLIPILYACRSVLGYPMMMSTIIVFMGIINIGFLLPSGSSIGAMLFGNSEWVTPKQIYMYAGFATVVALAAYCIAFAIGCVIIK
jgi:di/tricarboxylate transporter